MKKISIIFLPVMCFFLSFVSCAGEQKVKVDDEEGSKLDVYLTNHLNVVIVPDLSNRIDENIHPKPLHDTTIIRVLLEQIEPSLSLYKRKENQLDKWSLMTPNLKQTLKYDVEPDKMKIDFSRFKNQLQRTNYLFNRDVEVDFKEDLEGFKREFRKLYEKAEKEHKGLDLYQFFNVSLNDRYIAENPAAYDYMGSRYEREYRNILILITDGYIESSGFDANCKTGKCSELHYNFVDWVAQNSPNIDALSKFIQSKDLGLQPVNNPNLKDFEVLVIEVDDRSTDDYGRRKRKNGLTDFEVTQYFWEKWMKECGVEHFGYVEQFESELQVKRAFDQFLKEGEIRND